MKLAKFAGAAMCALLAAFATPAVADFEGDYSYVRTGTALDDLCRYLRYTERSTLELMVYDLAMNAPEKEQMGDTAFYAWMSELEAAADAKAESIGCTEEARPYLADAGDFANQRIYKDFLIAFYIADMSEEQAAKTRLSRKPVLADQRQAAEAYEGDLRLIYAENYQVFADAQVAEVIEKLPAEDDVSQDAQITLQLAHNRARDTLQMVHFEMAAELAGQFVRPHWYDEYNHTPGLQASIEGDPWAVVISGPHVLNTEEGEKVSGVFAIATAGGLRFITYGTEAAGRLESVKLLVRTAPAHAEGDPFLLEHWRSLTTAFDGTRLDEECLGAPCFIFPPEALTAIFGAGDGERAELWLSTTPGAEPVGEKESYLRNAVLTAILWNYGK